MVQINGLVFFMNKFTKNDQGVIWGAILAGGKSKRMGFAKEKLRLPDGRTMLEHVRDSLVESCENIIISGGDTTLGHDLIGDKEKNIGPIAGIASVLESKKSNSYLIVPCDLPLFDKNSALPLIKSLKKYPEYEMYFYKEKETGQLQFLPCIIKTKSIHTVRNMISEKKYALYHLARAIKTKKIYVEKKILRRIRSVNTQKDFAAICQIVSKNLL